MGTHVREKSLAKRGYTGVQSKTAERLRGNLRSDYGPTSAAELRLLHRCDSRNGLGGICVAGIEPDHFRGRRFSSRPPAWRLDDLVRARAGRQTYDLRAGENPSV